MQREFQKRESEVKNGFAYTYENTLEIPYPAVQALLDKVFALLLGYDRIRFEPMI